jgi:hypothetical protein
MITVTIAENGDIIYECPQCERKWTMPFHESASVFWDMHNGRMVLEALGHFRANH